MSALVETVGFFLATAGWAMLAVTLFNSYWRVSSVSGNVITTSTIFENLWQSCATDSTGVYNCWEFQSLLELPGEWGAGGRGARPAQRGRRAPGDRSPRDKQCNTFFGKRSRPAWGWRR
uniref:Claudin n=1 Tax=Varanus komodoensis TaxID=61221 RepID=A0A8D2IPI6_VARKO